MELLQKTATNYLPKKYSLHPDNSYFKSSSLQPQIQQANKKDVLLGYTVSFVVDYFESK